MTRRPRSRRLVCPHPLDPVWVRRFAPSPHPSSGDPDIHVNAGDTPRTPGGRRPRWLASFPVLCSPADRRNCEVSFEWDQVGSCVLNFVDIQGRSTKHPGYLSQRAILAVVVTRRSPSPHGWYDFPASDIEAISQPPLTTFFGATTEGPSQPGRPLRLLAQMYRISTRSC